MAKENKITLESNMMVIKVGYAAMLLPWAEGIEMLRLLEHVRFVSKDWNTDAKRYFWKYKDEELLFEVLDPMGQATLLLGGDDEPKL